MLHMKTLDIKAAIIWFCLYEMSRMGKPVEIESKFVIEAGGMGSDSDY